MARRYSGAQHDHYLRTLKETGKVWMEVFENEPEMYSAHYWDLFAALYENRHRDIKKTEALGFIKYTSSITAKKFVDKAIAMGYLVEEANKRDARSRLLRMTPKLMEKMEQVLDYGIATVSKGIREIEKKAPMERAS